MPLEVTEAVVLKSFPVGERDKLVVLFSRDKGLLRGIAKGARKFGNRFGSSLELMSYVKVFYYEKERQELATISQCDLLESFFDLPKDFSLICILSYWAELIEEFCPSRVKEEPLFRLLLACLRALKKGGDRHLLTRYFELWLLRLSGLLPDLRCCRHCRRPITQPSWLSPKRDGVYCEACAPEKKDPVPSCLISFVSWSRTSPPPEAGVQPLSSEEVQRIGSVLQSFLIYYLEKEPKSLRFLKA